jgi:predicted nucleic acid-binding protein
MRVVIDTNILVGEALRASGKRRLAHKSLDLLLPHHMWEETAHELPRRIVAVGRHRRMPEAEIEAMQTECYEAIKDNVTVLHGGAYDQLEDEARARSIRDPDDWPLVACALAFSAAIWTQDGGLFGTGVPTWTIETLGSWLERQPRNVLRLRGTATGL